jgi:ABC-type sulfate transport system permease subunit
VTATTTSTRRRTLPAVRWSQVLTVVLAVGYLVIGVTSPLPSVRWPALAGGLLVLVALWLASRSHSIALAALVCGAALPLVTGWWSLVLPVTGALILGCGVVAVRATVTKQ